MGLVVTSLKGIIIKKSLRLGFSATNNEAEYETLLEGMTMVQKMGVRTIEIFSDSRLVVGQVKGELEARDMRMQDYLSQVRHLQLGLSPFPYNKSQGAKTHMPTPLPPSQSPRHSVYLESSLSKTCISLPSSKRRGSLFTKLGWGLVGWILLCYFLRMTSCSRRK